MFSSMSLVWQILTYSDMRTLSKDITNIGWDIALMKTSGPHPPMVSHLDEMEDAAAEDGNRMEIHDPSSVPPVSKVMSPSAAEPSAHRSSPVMPSIQPASEVMATTATQTFAMPFKRNKPVPSTRSLGCKNCEVLSAELKAVRELLSDQVVRNAELQQLRLPTRRETVSIVIPLILTLRCHYSERC